MKIIVAIASTTHIDLHNQRMAKIALDGMAEQIRSKYIPQLIEHDPNRMIGVLLEGKVIEMDDGEFALYVVGGIFDNEEEKHSYEIGSKNLVWRKYSDYLNEVNTEIKQKDIYSTKKESEDLSITDLLEIHLDSTKIWIDGSVYFVKHFIASTKDLSIHVYPKDHWPAHFHVISKQRNIDARFDLDTLDLISEKRGLITQADIKKIKHLLQFNPIIFDKLRSEHARLQK